MAANIYDWSIVAANNSNSDSDLTWAEGQAPSTVNNSARVMMQRVKQHLIDLGGSIAAGGTANGLTVTASSPFAALADGLIVAFRATASNTGAATLNVNGIGAKAIRKMDSTGDVALVANEIRNTGLYVAQYSAALNGAAGAWLLVNPTFPFTASSLVTLTGTQTLTNKTLTSPIIGTSPTAAGATWPDLGTVTTVDINGGTIDGTIIGGATPAAITGTTITATGDLTVTGGDINIGLEAGFGDLVTNGTNGAVQVIGGTAFANGGVLRVYGSTHATQANDIEFFTASTQKYLYDASAAQHIWQDLAHFADTVRIGQNSTSSPGVGNNTAGVAITVNGGFFSATGSALFANRTTDGAVISIGTQGTTQGTISVAGAVTSYNPFVGSHWSQLMSDVAAVEMPVGTIVETVDELSDLGELGKRLPRYKVSDEAGSPAVYGVWRRHDDDMVCEEIASLGAYWIRIAAGHKVKRGDLIESNGDGCGRVQNGTNMRSSTVGKVSAAVVVETYPDGSYLVPCTLHCG